MLTAFHNTNNERAHQEAHDGKKHAFDGRRRLPKAWDSSRASTETRKMLDAEELVAHSATTTHKQIAAQSFQDIYMSLIKVFLPAAELPCREEVALFTISPLIQSILHLRANKCSPERPCASHQPPILPLGEELGLMCLFRSPLFLSCLRLSDKLLCLATRNLRNAQPPFPISRGVCSGAVSR